MFKRLCVISICFFEWISIQLKLIITMPLRIMYWTKPSKKKNTKTRTIKRGETKITYTEQPSILLLHFKWCVSYIFFIHFRSGAQICIPLVILCMFAKVFFFLLYCRFDACFLLPPISIHFYLLVLLFSLFTIMHIVRIEWLKTSHENNRKNNIHHNTEHRSPDLSTFRKILRHIFDMWCVKVYPLNPMWRTSEYNNLKINVNGIYCINVDF